MKILAEIDMEKLVDDSLKGVDSSAKDDAAEVLKVNMLEMIHAGRSPITGRKFPKLTKDYEQKKKSEGGSGNPDLELSGEMLDSLDVRVKGKKLQIVIDEEQFGKAEGNNIGSYGRDPNQKKARKFYPEDGERYTEAVLGDVKSILRDAIDEANADDHKD